MKTIQVTSIRELNAAARSGKSVVVFLPDLPYGLRISRLAIKNGFVHGLGIMSGIWKNVEFMPYEVR